MVVFQELSSKKGLFGYRQKEALAQHIKPYFSKKSLKWKNTSALTISFWIHLTSETSLINACTVASKRVFRQKPKWYLPPKNFRFTKNTVNKTFDCGRDEMKFRCEGWSEWDDPAYLENETKKQMRREMWGSYRDKHVTGNNAGIY